MLQEQLPDPSRAPADVQDGGCLEFAGDGEGELTAIEEARAEKPLQRVLFVVQVVKRERLLAKVFANASRSVG